MALPEPSLGVGLLAGAPAPPPPSAVVLRGATVSGFGTSAHDIIDSVVVLRGGTIEAVGPASQVPLPAGAQTLDVSGLYIVAGLTCSPPSTTRLRASAGPGGPVASS